MSARVRKRVLLAAGGTGGHMFPAQALARELLDRGDRVALVTDRRAGGFGPDLPQVETCYVAAGAVTGRDWLARAKGLLRLGVGYLQARHAVRRLKPDVVVGFGGYASLPGVMAAAHAGVPVILHEQNAVVGRANRLLVRRARAVATAFPDVEGLTPADRDKVVATGNPVRGAVAAVGRKPYAVADSEGPLRLLVTGGSQGARVFNALIPQAVCGLPDDQRRRVEVAQQVRGGDHEEVAAAYDGCGVRPTLQSFFEDLPERLRQAHLVICRAGASTVAELAAAGRPAILVPYPFAADDHQTANARQFAEAGAGWLMPQDSLTPEGLAERLGALLANPAALARAASCARGFGFDDSAKRLADLVDAFGRHDGDSDRKEAAA